MQTLDRIQAAEREIVALLALARARFRSVSDRMRRLSRGLDELDQPATAPVR